VKDAATSRLPRGALKLFRSVSASLSDAPTTILPATQPDGSPQGAHQPSRMQPFRGVSSTASGCHSDGARVRRYRLHGLRVVSVHTPHSLSRTVQERITIDIPTIWGMCSHVYVTWSAAHPARCQRPTPIHTLRIQPSQLRGARPCQPLYTQGIPPRVGIQSA
jgi:hypothetical protein